MALTLVDEPDAEPIALTDAKTQCKVDADLVDEDAWIEDFLIPAARERAEGATGRQLIQAEWDYKLDGFPCWEIEIPKPPLISITHVKYVDTSGVEQTLVLNTDYVVDAPAGPRCARGRITPAYNESWPSTRPEMNAVTIRFKAGYGTAGASVPPLLRQGMLIDIGTLYLFREDVVAGTIVAKMPRDAARIYRHFRSRPLQRLAA